jgi:formate dehydrogenase major subunit
MNRLGYNQAPYDPKTLLEEISQIVPFFAGVRWDELGENGKQWPVALDGTGTEILHTETFKRGKGKFQMATWKETQELVQNKDEFPYILTTNRELEHYNCGTMTRRTGNAVIVKDDVLLINPKDAETHLINDGEMVCVISPRGKIDVKAKISNDVKQGILSSTFHFPDIKMNDLTSSVTDTEALCPEYKVVAVNIRKSKGKYKEVLS